MLVKSYCDIVGCERKVMAVNGTRWSVGVIWVKTKLWLIRALLHDGKVVPKNRLCPQWCDHLFRLFPSPASKVNWHFDVLREVITFIGFVTHGRV